MVGGCRHSEWPAHDVLRHVRRRRGAAQDHDVVWGRRQCHPMGDDGVSDLASRPHARLGLDGRLGRAPQSLYLRPARCDFLQRLVRSILEYGVAHLFPRHARRTRRPGHGHWHCLALRSLSGPTARLGHGIGAVDRIARPDDRPYSWRLFGSRDQLAGHFLSRSAQWHHQPCAHFCHHSQRYTAGR